MTNLYVELRDGDDVLVDRIENKIENLTWVWNRIGGCGSCKFTLKEEFNSTLALLLKPNYRISIVIDGTTWYSGFIDKVTSKVTGSQESISVLVLGFVYLLKFLVLDDLTYTSQELSAIAKDIIDTYVTPYTSITSSSGDYDDTDFTPDTLSFNNTVFEAIKTLGDIPGKREWGVNADKEFFFLTRSSEVEHFIHLDEDVSSYDRNLDYSRIITKVIVEGGDVDGDRYQLEVSLTGATYTREKRVTYGSVTTQSVAQRLGRAVIKEFGLPKRTYKLVRKTDERLETVLPIGLVAVNLRIGIKEKYDAGHKYDDGHKYDGGTESFQLDSIAYVVSPADDKLSSTLNVGVIPSELVETISQQKFLLNQVKNY